MRYSDRLNLAPREPAERWESVIPTATERAEVVVIASFRQTHFLGDFEAVFWNFSRGVVS